MDPGPASPISSNSRPRAASRGISFRSDHSDGSASRAKSIESARDKAQRDSIWKGQTKANPNAAINEAQPGVVQAVEQSTLQNIRDGFHKDAYGNIIADPDRSNPTRPRLERPLDTIRSFEKAIDDGYKRRNSYMRQDSEQWDKENQFASRRSSYFGGQENGQGSHRPGPGSNVGGYYGSQSYYGPPRTRYSNNRMQSDSQLYGHRPYPQHGYHQSHDTVNTGYTNGSDSTGPWASGTDPSSENSSIDKVHAMNKPSTPGMDGYNQYGGNGYHGPIMEEQGGANAYNEQWQEHGTGMPSNTVDYGQPNGYANGYAHQNGYSQQNGYGQQNPYGQRNGMGAPPVQQPNQARRPIQLGGNSSGEPYGRQSTNMPPPVRREPEPEKRQSWIKRRFSKKN